MYGQLKQIMKNSGYIVSDGDDWAAADTEQFIAFAKYVLGVQGISPNQVLAYPQAFPRMIEALTGLSFDEPAASQDAYEPAVPTTESAPIPSVDTPPVQSSEFDVSGGTGAGVPPVATLPETESVTSPPAEDTEGTDSGDTESDDSEDKSSEEE